MAKPKRAMSIAEIGSKFENFSTQEGEAHGMAYQPEPTDIFIVTPAKCGTTWMQQIVHGLRTRGSMDFDEITRVVPWIEMAKDMGIDIYKPQVANPRAFKTHKNLNDVPKGGKYIEVLRDPKDAMLSLYRFFEGWIFEPGCISIEEFALDLYIGTNGRGYWDHIKALWARRNDKNVLPLCYENMKQDLPSAVKRVAEFMGIELDDPLKDVVVEQSNFKFMNEHNHKFDDHIIRDTRNEICGIPADGATSKVKTGKVGEGKLLISQKVMDEFERVWQEEITSMLGLQSYEELRQVLVN